MRLLVKLSPSKATPQPVNQYYIQSAIYNLLRKTQFSNLHSGKRYKYFCFSNIFPFTPRKPLLKDKNYNMLISSPQREFIGCLVEKIKKKDKIRLGSIDFYTKKPELLLPEITKSSKIVTSTPVVITIPKTLYEKYGLESKRDYLYFRSDMPLNAFVDAVSKNSVRKFNNFFELKYPENLILFKTFRFRRGALVNYKGSKIAGSIWEFTPIGDKKALSVLRFILDCGLGEKNSAGFGFLNIDRIKYG